MDLTLKNLRMADGSLVDLVVKNGIIESITPADAAASVAEQRYLFPGFVDVHVHLREPGFSHKETIATGTLASARGGFTDVCPMPNLKPVPDSVETLAMQQELIRRDAMIRVHPYGAITAGQNGEQMADLEGMAKAGALAFSDDGRGVQSEAMMKDAMREAKRLGKMIVAHCEDNSLLYGGYIHDGEYAKTHGHKGICSESEWGPIARDLKLVEETGVAYHVCHISTKESVQIIREAKRRGVNVTCETGPHYLLMDDSMLQEDGRFKMNPPIRGKEDREALVQGLLDGTIDMIATDHAPHSAEEKSKGLVGSLNGVVGIETSFATLYTGLVKTGILTLSRLVELMHHNPAERFGIAVPLAVGQKANFTVFELDTEYTIDPADFRSMGKASPFTGWQVFGRCLLTVCDGNIAWNDMEELK